MTVHPPADLARMHSCARCYLICGASAACARSSEGKHELLIQGARRAWWHHHANHDPARLPIRTNLCRKLSGRPQARHIHPGSALEGTDSQRSRVRPFSLGLAKAAFPGGGPSPVLDGNAAALAEATREPPYFRLPRTVARGPPPSWLHRPAGGRKAPPSPRTPQGRRRGSNGRTERPSI